MLSLPLDTRKLSVLSVLLTKVATKSVVCVLCFTVKVTGCALGYSTVTVAWRSFPFQLSSTWKEMCPSSTVLKEVSQVASLLTEISASFTAFFTS